MKTKVVDMGALLGVVYRLGFVVATLFLAYKVVVANSRNVFLQDYMATLRPSPVTITSSSSIASPTLADKSSGSTLQESSGSTLQESSGSTLQESSGSTLQESSGSTLQESSGSTLQESSGSTLQESSGSTLQGSGSQESNVKKLRNSTWPLLYPSYTNEGESVLRQLHESTSKTCYKHGTMSARITGLPSAKAGKRIRLETGKIHELKILAYDSKRRRRCAGGDYYELDLTGPRWKARPPILDNRDGSYGVQLMVDSAFPGIYVFKVILLFSSFHALDARKCSAWARFQDMFEVEIEFLPPKIREEYSLRTCGNDDFGYKAWAGRWIRHKWNETCEIRDDGHYICIDKNEDCKPEWCEGKVGALESNGWSYSAHCKFKIFSQDEAWQCLNNRWLFFWGDSNNEDSVRNLLSFVLGMPIEEVGHLRRWFNGTFTRPGHPDQSVTITKIFNGHWQELGNLAGLSSLWKKSYRQLLQSYWYGARAPDTMIMNSGLHDAHFYKSARKFAEGVDYAIQFWKNIWRDKKPSVVYRTTITGAGYSTVRAAQARNGLSNPHKMELYNRIFVERLQKKDVMPNRLKVVDAFDMTFPWHYDLNHTDGVHYGREPSKTPWPWHPTKGKKQQIGHQYFVDVQLVHILLNAICPVSQTSPNS